MATITGNITPQQIERTRGLADLLTGQALQGGPIQSPLQGLGQLAQAFAARTLIGRANRQETARQGAANQALISLLGGGAAPSPAAGAQFASAGGPVSAAGGVPPAGGALAQLATGGPSQARTGPSAGALLQLAQQFPELSGVLNPLLSASLQGPKTDILSPGQVAFRGGQEVARVPAAEKAPEFKTDLGKLQGDQQLAGQLFGEDSPQFAAFNEALQGEAAGEPIDLTDEGGQRREFTKASGDFIKLRDAFGKILKTDDSASGDMSLIFSFMKILDPGSTVREGEFATAQQTAGIPDRIVAGYNRARAGTRLAPVQREDFRNQAANLFTAQRDQQNLLEDQFTGLATRSGLRPPNVVIDFQGDMRNLGQPAGDGAAGDFSGMSASELRGVDAGNLTDEQLDQLDAAMTAAGL